MESPMISVIVPVYNVEKYLNQCLQSIYLQTYKDYEVIIVNDGSTDKSEIIINKYKNKIENMKILNQKNSGLSVSRNNGLEISTGKYVCFLDSDDYILPETFEKLINQVLKNDLDLIRFSANPFFEDLRYEVSYNQYDLNKHYEFEKIYRKNDFLENLIFSFRGSACLYIIKKEIIEKNEIKFKPDIWHEDELFTLEAFLNVQKMMYDPNAYYQRRYRSNSIMTSVQESEEKSRKSFESYCIVVEESKKLLNRYQNPHEIKLIKNRIKNHHIGLIYNDSVNKKYKKIRLSKLHGMDEIEKIYYHARYKIKMILT